MSHTRSKVHKRRLRELRDIPYSQEEADAAVGMGLEKFQQKVQRHKERRAREQLEIQEMEALKTAKKDTVLGALVDNDGEVLMV